jgi:hypothetical protein
MQAVEEQTLILYHTDLRGRWPHPAARAFAARLPYARRLALQGDTAGAHASLAGIALAVRALAHLCGHAVLPAELVFAERQKPRLARAGAPQGGAQAAQLAPSFHPDFSISHSGSWVGCAAMVGAHVGFDLEAGSDARITDWVVREALLKATGEGLRALGAVRSVCLEGDIVSWRGAVWHLTRPDGFCGATACIATSVPVLALERHALGPEELFVS